MQGVTHSPRCCSARRNCAAAARRAEGYAVADVIGFVTERGAGLEPITLDLTGRRLAAALAGNALSATAVAHLRRPHRH